MAGKKISELQALTEITGQEMIPVARDGQNYSVLSSLLQGGDATKLNDYMYDVSELMGKMAVRGTQGEATIDFNKSDSGAYDVDGTIAASAYLHSTYYVKPGYVYYFNITFPYVLPENTAFLVLFDKDGKVLKGVPANDKKIFQGYFVFTSEVYEYGVSYSTFPGTVSDFGYEYEIQDINDVLSSMNTEIEANTASISAIEGNINTSQGNRALYVAAGAVYNEQTGFYELNGLTDITEEQMRNIYVKTNEMDKYGDLISSYVDVNIRTNLGFYENTYRFQKSISIFDAFRGSAFEVLKLGAVSLKYRTPVSNVNSAFIGCRFLKKIIGVLDFAAITGNVSYTFSKCLKLEDVFIKNLKVSIPFSDSPLLSLESLQYLITNAANTSAITITVHPDVYAKIQDETQTDWHALIEAATAKQITFATA